MAGGQVSGADQSCLVRVVPYAWVQHHLGALQGLRGSSGWVVGAVARQDAARRLFGGKLARFPRESAAIRGTERCSSAARTARVTTADGGLRACSPSGANGASVVMPHRTVLVTEAYALGMIGVIRCLGQAGYLVHAVASDAGALGFHSRFAAASAVHPSYRDPAFVGWLRAYCQDNAIQAIVPSEGFLHALGSAYDEFRQRLPDANDSSVVKRCLSKVQVFEWLAARVATAGHHPVAGVVRTTEDIPSEASFAPLCKPIYVKVDAGFARDGFTAGVRKCGDAGEARKALSKALETHAAALWQSHVPG